MKILDKPSFPKEIVQAEAKPQLLAQAVRVYLASQRQGTQSALTRAEVSRTRKKFQKQKGSGNARHGDKKAPIFVGGGVSFAPKPRDHSLALSKHMRKKALYGALNSKLKTKNLLVISGMDKLTGKTSEVAEFLAGLEGSSRKLLILTDAERANIYRAARNIPGVTILPMRNANPYEIIRADQVLIMEEALRESSSVKSTAPVAKVSRAPKEPAKTKTKVAKTKPPVKKARAVKKSK